GRSRAGRRPDARVGTRVARCRRGAGLLRRESSWRLGPRVPSIPHGGRPGMPRRIRRGAIACAGGPRPARPRPEAVVNPGPLSYAAGRSSTRNVRVRGDLMWSRLLALLALTGVTVAAPRLPSWGQTGPPRDLAHGQELFVRYCSGCHGE